MKKFLVMLLAVGFMAGAANFMAGAANADILLTSGATYDVFITDPVAVGANPAGEALIGFDLYFVNTTGNGAFDASAFDGVAFGYTGITSGMHNAGTGLHQQYSAALATTTETLGSSYASAIDTHFMDSLGNMLVVTAPSETHNMGASLEPSDQVPPFDAFATLDFGDQLTGTFAFTAAPSLTVAHIVIRDPGLPLAGGAFGTGVVSLDFFLSGTGGGDILLLDIVPVPEPATMGLLAIGGLGALIRRRR